jgi:hypothetical protein
MNENLFYSSIAIGSLIVYISIQFFKKELLPIYILTYIGIITSIMNHGISSDYIISKNVMKIIDRGFMCILSIVYLYYYFQMKDYFPKQLLLSIIILMIFLYLSSKIVKLTNKNISIYMHMVVHILTLFAFTIVALYE